MKNFNNIFYMYSKLDSSSQILLFLIILVALMLVSIGVINLITKKKNEKYLKKFHPISIKENKKVDKIEQKKEIKIEPKEEIEKIEEINDTEEPEIIEVVSSDNSIDKISELLEDGMNNMDPINLNRFEEEKEKNAIISYDELVKRAGAKKIIYKTEKATINEAVKQEKIQANDEPKGKFKASKIISPIYGVRKEPVVDNNKEELIELEDINDKNHMMEEDEEIRKEMDFLGNLKSFRSKLD